MNTLFQRLEKLNTGNPYFPKDLMKAKKANKFIGRGTIISSTHKYMLAAGDLANTGSYQQDDVVFISTEGARKVRFPAHCEEIDKAIQAKVTFVTDNKYNREREYNIGEREVAEHLKKNGYKEVEQGIWKI